MILSRQYGNLSYWVKARHALSHFMCFLLFFQPLLLQAAEIEAARSAAASQQPGVEAAGNGVPLINIVAPNGSGLSHNKYNQFNVGQSGAIFNNSNQNLQRSQLGGLVQGNPNLSTSEPASVVILNEIISSSRSLLGGTLEVHGGRADVIVANPNGITCNGCGFINTPRVTLSTGRPELESTGMLKSLVTEAGDISIGLNGANLETLDAFELVSRKISIGGPVKVLGDLDLVVGRNSYAYQSGLITPLAADGNEPGVAIDASLLGGIYAGRIKIIATDSGAGVNMLGQMVANADAMTMTAAGKLVLGNVRAKKGITATSKADAVRVKGTVFSEQTIALEGKSAVNLDDNALVAASGDVSLTAEIVSIGHAALAASGASEDGTQSHVGNLTVESSQLNAGNGQLAAGDTLTVTVSTLNLDRAVDDETDVLRSLGKVVLNAETIAAQNARVTALGAIDLKSASSLDLTGGLYSTAGSLLVEANTVTTSAALNAEGTVTLRGTNGYIVNSGRAAGDEGTIVNAATSLRNEGGLFSVKTVDITSTDALTNTLEGRVVGNAGVVLKVASLDNAGKIAAQGSDLTINTGGNLDNTGQLSGLTADVHVDGKLTNSGKLEVANALTVKGYTNTHSAALINHAGGKMSSGSGDYSVASLNNAGTVKTKLAELEMDVIGAITNRGNIEAKTTGTIKLGGDLSNAGSIISEKALVIAGRSGGRLGLLSNTLNTALINGGEHLSIAAAAVENAGEIGSADGNLLVELTGDLTNQGLFYSGTSSVYKFDGSLRNTNADILAETDLTLEGLSAERAVLIQNSTANIEAISGDLDLSADAIINQRTRLDFQTSLPTESSSSNGKSETRSVTTRELGEGTAASRLLAGGNITVGATTLTNHYSQIAANGDITIRADKVENIGRDLIKVVDTTTITSHVINYCVEYRIIYCHDREWKLIRTPSYHTSTSTYASVFATIEAGGKLDAVVSGYLKNDAVREGADQIGLSSDSRALDSASVASEAGPGNLLNPNAFDVNIESLLSRRALFDEPGEPNAPFLVETRSNFIDPNEYLGSDFFLNQAGGYDPDQNIRRFGDAYVETRLILAQVFDLTGQRYLGDAIDTRGVIQSLYENAIDAQQMLGLAFGVALTPAQIAQLTEDITWLEERVVRGETVLVPRVYLSLSTLSKGSLAGAQIKADQASFQVAILRNSGDITGRNHLDVTASVAVLNQGGGLFSRGDVVMHAGKLFSNRSGRVSGDDVTIKADNILNDTAKTRDKRDNGFTDRKHQVGRIEAKGNLLLEAEEVIVSTGGEFVSGGTTTLDAGRAVVLNALEIERRAEDTFEGGYNKESSLINHLAVIDAGKSVTINSGGSVLLRGTEVASGGDANISAEDDVNIVAVQDYQSKDFKVDIKTSGLFGTETNIREQSASTNTRGSRLNVAGKLNIISKRGDITIDASRLASQAEMTLRAAGKVALLTNTDTDYEQKKRREESALWWSESDKGQVKERIQHVEMEAGGGLKIDAGGGIVVEYEKTGDFQSSIEQLAESPGLSWMGQLKSDPRVDWVEVESRFDSWDYESQGLTEAGAALVSLVVAAASGGALSNLSGSLAQGLGFAADGAVQAALQTGLSTLTRQVSVTLINHQGDIGATLDSLGSSDALRSLATAMVASGLIVRVSDATHLGVELPSSAPLADRVVQDLHRGLLRATVNAGASALVEGGSFDESFVAALRQESAAVIGENVAQKIGIAARSGDIDTTTQIVAHAALGCVTGAVAADDCGSGAIGGAVGETIGLILLSDKRAEAVGSELGAALQKGELTPEEARELAYQWQQQGVDLSKLAAGLSAALVGGNVDVAANTAENAVENNALCGGACITGALAVIGALWTTYDVASVYQEEGGEAALKQLAVDGVITVALGGAYTVGKITYKSTAKAYQAAKEAGLLRGVARGAPSIKQQALDLKKLNNNKNTVTVQSPGKKTHFDLDGATHKGVETPHKQLSRQNVNPKTGETFFNKDRTTVEPLHQQDIRTVRNILERRNQ